MGDLPTDLHDTLSTFLSEKGWKKPKDLGSLGSSKNLMGQARFGIVIGGFDCSPSSASKLDTTLVMIQSVNTEGTNCENIELTQNIVDGYSQQDGKSKKESVLCSSGCEIMDEDSLPIREKRIRQAHE